MKGAFREQKVSKSAKAKVDEPLARESHQLQEQNIHKICAAMEVQLYRAEQVTTSKGRRFQVCLNRTQQVTTIWSDTDRQRAIERLQRKIHQVTPAKPKIFDKLCQHHERQLLQEVGNTATCPRGTFANKLTQMKSAAEDEAYGALNMIADKHVKFQVHPCDAGTEAITWNIADTDGVVNQLVRVIYCITSKYQMGFMKEFSIRLVEFEAWWQAIGIQELRQTIQQRVIHFGYPR